MKRGRNEGRETARKGKQRRREERKVAGPQWKLLRPATDKMTRILVDEERN